MKYKEIKLFRWWDIPHHATRYSLFKEANTLLGSNALDYTAYKYIIGTFTDEYDAADESEKADYVIEEIKVYREIDNWFKEQGCSHSEMVFISDES